MPKKIIEEIEIEEMDEDEYEPIEEPEPPTHYDVIPEFNRLGRVCNYHTGFREGESEEDLARVPIEEWERFNQLAGRQHEVVDGEIVFNESLEPTLPDELLDEHTHELLEQLDEIDRKSVRPMRAIMRGTGTDEDTERLAELEQQAEDIRDEMRVTI